MLRQNQMAQPVQDKWIKCISTHGNIRGIAIEATGVVRAAVQLHGLTGLAAQGLGEAMIGGMLIGSHCKGGERVNLNIRGSGLFKQALVDAYPDGTVRGYVIERVSTEDLLAAGNGPWGEGLLSVLRTKEGEKREPYIGTVPLVTGWLAKDLSFYWAQSEQIPSAVGLITNISAAGEVTSAGGFLIQALPGASPAEVRSIESHINDLHTLAESASRPVNAGSGRHLDPMNILSRIFQSTAFIVVEEKPLKFSCNCSWERVERALVLVGVQELRSMLKEDSKATVSCDFCTKEYLVDAENLERLIGAASGN